MATVLRPYGCGVGSVASDGEDGRLLHQLQPNPASSPRQIGTLNTEPSFLHVPKVLIVTAVVVPAKDLNIAGLVAL